MQNLVDLQKKIDDYMDYYNNDCYQWDLNRIILIQYRVHIKITYNVFFVVNPMK